MSWLLIKKIEPGGSMFAQKCFMNSMTKSISILRYQYLSPCSAKNKYDSRCTDKRKAKGRERFKERSIGGTTGCEVDKKGNAPGWRRQESTRAREDQATAKEGRTPEDSRRWIRHRPNSWPIKSWRRVGDEKSKWDGASSQAWIMSGREPIERIPRISVMQDLRKGHKDVWLSPKVVENTVVG